MLIKTWVFFIGATLLLVGCATTGQEGNMASMFRSESSTDLGVRYLLGRGVPRNESKAFHYFSQGANEDDPFAENELAYMYASGKGTSQNDAKALYWYQQAANHGLASAQYNLGLMYLHGLGTAPSRTLALKWFQKSAAHGFEPARDTLARLRQ